MRGAPEIGNCRLCISTVTMNCMTSIKMLHSPSLGVAAASPHSLARNELQRDEHGEVALQSSGAGAASLPAPQPPPRGRNLDVVVLTGNRGRVVPARGGA